MIIDFRGAIQFSHGRFLVDQARLAMRFYEAEIPSRNKTGRVLAQGMRKHRHGTGTCTRHLADGSLLQEYGRSSVVDNCRCCKVARPGRPNAWEERLHATTAQHEG